MDTIKHVNEINGFVEAYEEVYNDVLKNRSSYKKDDFGFVLMRAHDVVEEFEKRYNVNLLSKNHKSSVGEMVYAFDTVDFKTEENMTMCLLKWT